MKNVALNIDHTTQPQKLAAALKEHDLRQGDKLTVTTPPNEEMALLIVLVAFAVLHHLKIDYANKVLKNIFASKGSKDIQDEIAREYGIEVQVKAKETSEEDSWRQFSKEKLSKAYSANEPEYDLSMVKEPNPDYKK